MKMNFEPNWPILFFLQNWKFKIDVPKAYLKECMRRLENVIYKLMHLNAKSWDLFLIVDKSLSVVFCMAEE